jgi:hypothetical protein
MEITERKKFDFLLANHCINRVGWNPNDDQKELRVKFAQCIHLVSRAETIFRGHLLNPVPGEVKYYASGLDE